MREKVLGRCLQFNSRRKLSAGDIVISTYFQSNRGPVKLTELVA